jgi:hypothetical protein
LPEGHELAALVPNRPTDLAVLRPAATDAPGLECSNGDVEKFGGASFVQRGIEIGRYRCRLHVLSNRSVATGCEISDAKREKKPATGVTGVIWNYPD